MLLFGRKLYWLALGGCGFFVGLWLAGRHLHLESDALNLGLGFLLAVAGALLAIFAQRLAISLGGFFLGGVAGFWVAAILAHAFQWQQELWLWVTAGIGALVGVAFAAVLFDSALVVFSSMVGAFLIASRTGIGPPQETWLFLIMLCLGVMMQSRRPAPPAKT